MKKLFMIIYVVILFFGIVECPFSDDPAHRTIASTTATNAVVGVHTADGDSGSPVPEPISLVLLGSGLVGLAFIGRKKFGK